MADYTFISSRDPVSGDHSVHDIACDLASGGHSVTLFMVENGTFLARESACADLRQKLVGAGVTLMADEFALAERGIADGSLAKGVAASSLETVVDHMANGHKVSWH